MASVHWAKRLALAWRSGWAHQNVLLTDDAGSLLPSPRRTARLWDRAVASSRAGRLDACLAAGVAPESGRLIALRAAALVVPPRRRRLASDWDRLVRVARERPATWARVPLRSDGIVAAEEDIWELQRSLRADVPVPARGVAMASTMLTDGAGPLYNRHSPVSVHAAVREIIQHLDPTTALLPVNSGAADESGGH
jgi:hypothetical protein